MYFLHTLLAPRGTSGERGNPITPRSSPRPTTSGLTHSLCRCAASAPNRPSAHAAEKIRDVGDNVPPRWEGCCPQRPIISLRDARRRSSTSRARRSRILLESSLKNLTLRGCDDPARLHFAACKPLDARRARRHGGRRQTFPRRVLTAPRVKPTSPEP